MLLDDELGKQFQTVDTTLICDADKATRVMDDGIRPRSANRRIFGPAFTVRCRDDHLAVLRAVELAAPGDVIVVDGGSREIALAGEMFARGALARSLGGIVVDGGYRDMAYVATSQLPVYSRFATPMAGTSRKLGELRLPIVCGGVTVSPGDLVLADEEGIVVVDPTRVRDLLDSAVAAKENEIRTVARMDSGAHLSDIFNLDAHTAALRRGEASTLRASA